MDILERTILTFGKTYAILMTHAIRKWAYISFARSILIASLIGMVLLGSQVLFMRTLFAEVTKKSEYLSHESATLVKELLYKSALDSIVLCMDSIKEKSSLRNWYCEEAVMKYKRVSEDGTPNQNRVKEVAEKLAYGAMKNDVSHYLRSIELERLHNSPASREEEILNFLLNKVVFTLWVFFAVFLTVGTYFMLRVLPIQKRSESRRISNRLVNPRRPQ